MDVLDVLGEPLMEIDQNTLNLLISVLLPFAVALVTKKVADRSVKGLMLAVLSGVTAALSAAAMNKGVLSQETLYLGIQNFVVSTATYFGLWEPTGAAAKIAEKTQNFGLTIKADPNALPDPDREPKLPL